MAETMPAWRRETYGPADGMTLEHVPVPVPVGDDVLIRVRATALNAADVRIMLGDPLLVRPVFGLTRPKQPIRGIDVVGTVIATGPKALGVEVGEEIVGEIPAGGGLAAYATIPAARVVPLPPDIADASAACLPCAGGTAWQALDLAGVGVGSGNGFGAHAPRVLVIGASGGVGTFLVQLAVLRSAEVWATCGAHATGLIEALGAVRTFDHRRSPLSNLPAGRFDAVIDIVGGIPLRELRRLAAPTGTVVLVSGDGGHVLGPLPRMLKAALLSLGRGPRIRMLAATSRPEVLRRLLELVAEGRVVPVIEREYAFADAAAALARIESGHVVGKLVVRAG